MVTKGFKFGMLLQLAIGPVCLFIFQMANLKGFYWAEAGVLGVVFIDAIFILAAILGIGSLLERKRVQAGLKIFGAVILFLFGASTVLGQFQFHLLPSLSIQSAAESNNIFLHTVLLTISNPLTILFWAGVFSTKIIEENLDRRQIYVFGLGALLSTLVFLTLVALIGSFTQTFFPSTLIQMMNLAVGCLLIYFSIRMARKPV